MIIDNKGDITQNILLNLKVDTMERVDAMFGDFNVDNVKNIEDIIPKNLPSDGIIDFARATENLPNIYKLLDSPDERKRHLGRQALAQRASVNPAMTSGLGLNRMVKYQEGQDKFTGGESFWNNNGKYGFDPTKSIAENEDYYKTNVWDNYSTFGKIWRGTGTFAGRVLSKFTTGLVGMVGDVSSIAWNGLQELTDAVGISDGKNEFWADFSDNWLARQMEHLDENVKKHVLPTYKALNFDDKGVFSKLKDPYFWQNDIADGAGFLMQFMVPGVALGKLGMLGKAGKLGKFGNIMGTEIGGLASSTKGAKFAGNAAEFLTGARDGFGIAAHAFNTSMESLTEAKEGFRNTVKDLMQKGLSEQEAKNIAAQYAPEQFGLNMGILTFSNALENRWFQQIAKKVPMKRFGVGDDLGLEKTYTNKLSKLVGTNKYANQAAFYGNKMGKGIGMEGFWEENAQLAAQRTVREDYMRRGDDTIGLEGKLEKSESFFKQFIKQTADAIKGNDREAADSITAGAVIGIVAGAGIPKVFGGREIVKDEDGNLTSKRKLFKGERRQKLEDETDAILRIKNTRDAFLSISSMPNNMYDIVDGEAVPNKEKFEKRAAEINEKLSKISSVFKRSVSAEMLMDGRKRERIQAGIFADYLKANILNGAGDVFLDRLKEWGNKDAKELELYGVTPEMNINPKKWAAIGEKLYNEFKKVDRIPYQNNGLTVDQYNDTLQAVKSTIFEHESYNEFSRQSLDDLDVLISDLDLKDSYSEYNKLLNEKLLLSAQPGDEFKKRIAEIDEQLKLKKELLTDYTEVPLSEDGSMYMFPNSVSREDMQDGLENLYIYGELLTERYKEQLQIEENEEVLKRLRDPENGLDNHRNTIIKSIEFTKKAKDNVLVSLGFDPSKMTEEEKEKAFSENKVNPNAPKDAAGNPVSTAAAPNNKISDETINGYVNSIKNILRTTKDKTKFLEDAKKALTNDTDNINDIFNSGLFRSQLIIYVGKDLVNIKLINALFQDVIKQDLINESSITKEEEEQKEKEKEEEKQKEKEKEEVKEKVAESIEMVNKFAEQSQDYFEGLQVPIVFGAEIETLKQDLINSLC